MIDDIEVKAKSSVEETVVNYLVDQIDTALRDRAEKERRWEKWIKQYEEILPQTKAFPWKGCSNISVPVTPIAVETIHAREVNTLFSVRPYIQVKPKKSDASKDNCYAIERFFDQVQDSVLNLYEKGSMWLLEKNKMGTGYIKPYWCYDKKKMPDGSFRIKDDADVDVVMIEDVIYPTNARDIQSALFVAQRIRTDWNNLSKRNKLGIYKNVDKIKQFVEEGTQQQESGNDIQKTKEDIEKMQRSSPQTLGEYVIYEVYFDYDIDNDGFPEQTVMTLHKESNTVLRWIKHPYHHGRRPFIPNTYMQRVGRIDGKGIAEMSEYLQEATNTVFNQTIDNMTLANAKVFKVRKQAKEDMPKEGIYPGVSLYLDDPQTDFMEFQMGDVKQSNFALVNILRDYHERRTKVTDYTLGRESSALKSRATATGTLALLQESGRHFDLVINNSRKALVELAYQVIELYMQYRPDKVIEVIGSSKTQEPQKRGIFSFFKRDGSVSSEVIRLPHNLHGLRENYEFYCQATSIAVNKEIEKQTNLIMIQQLGGLFQQMIQLLMMTNNPQMQLPPDIQKFVYGVLSSYYRMAQDLVRSFEKVDIDSYLPELPAVVQQAYGMGMGEFMGQLGGAINGGGAGGLEAIMAGLAPQQGMGGIPPQSAGPPDQGY